MKWIGTLILILSTSLNGLAAASDVQNFYTQFDRPVSSLTLFVESLLLTDHLTKLKSESKLSQWLMAKTLSTPERELVLTKFLQAWTDALKANLKQDYAHEELDTASFFEAYFSPVHLAADPNRKYVKTLLQEGFSDKLLAFLNMLYELERQNLTSAQKVSQMLNQADIVVTYDEDFLNVAAQIGVIFSYSADTSISASAMHLLTDVARKQRVAGAFDPLSPEMLLGGSGIFRSIVGSSLVRVGIFRTALAWITEVPTKYALAIGSASFHAAALLALTADPNADDKKNEKVKQQILAENSSAVQSIPSPRVAPKVPVTFSENMLYAKAYSLLKNPEYAATSVQYGDLFAEGEIEFDVTTYYMGGGISPAMDHLVMQGVATPYDVRRVLDAKTLEFDNYMKSRNLQTLDSKAILKLRLLVADLVSNYKKGETFSLPLILGSNQPGNCVARALVHTAFFYPLFLKYKPANLEYGMIATMDHIEAVLFNTQTKTMLSIQSMDQLHDPDHYYGPGRLTIYSPKILLANYLYRKFALIPYEFKDLVLHSSTLTNKAAENFAEAKRFACAHGSPCKDLMPLMRDSFTAPALEATVFFRNPFGDGLVGDPTYMESFLPTSQDPSPGLTANIGSAAKTEGVIIDKVTQSKGTVSEVSATAQYAAQKRIQNFTTSYLFGAEDLSAATKPSPCVRISGSLMACTTTIPQYLSFPVFNVRGVFNVLIDQNSDGSLPFTNVTEFADFLKGTTSNFFETSVYLDLQSKLQNINSSQYPSIDSLISSLNLYALYMDLKNAPADSVDLKNLRKELVKNEGFIKIANEAAKFKKLFSSLLEDKSGASLQRFFGEQIRMDDSEIMKRGTAFQVWYSLLEPAEKVDLLNLMKRVVWNVPSLKQKTQDLTNATAPNLGNPKSTASIAWLSSHADPNEIAVARAEVQARLLRTQDSRKINITVNSFTGIFILSTFADDFDEQTNMNLMSKFNVEDFLSPATKMGKSLATVNTRWSSVNQWLGVWGFLSESYRGKNTQAFKIASTVANALFQQ